jgi:SAM-dependent methyltransferase
MRFDYDSVPGNYQHRALASEHRMQAFWHAGKLAMIDRLVRSDGGSEQKILEIGCGSGNLLLRAVAQGGFPVALDISVGALRFVRRRLIAWQLGSAASRGFLCTQAMGEGLPLLSDSLDWVLLSEVIEHLADPGLVVREARRVLRSGGRLLVTTPNYHSLWPILEWGIDRLGLAPKMAGEQHIAPFRADSLREILLASNLEIEKMGSIYSLSPFLALLSSRLAERALTQELRHLRGVGMILVAVARKP